MIWALASVTDAVGWQYTNKMLKRTERNKTLNASVSSTTGREPPTKLSRGGNCEPAWTKLVGADLQGGAENVAPGGASGVGLCSFR